MGFFDSIKKAMGGGDPEPDVVKGPSAILKEAGIDPAGLDFDIKGDGRVIVTGWVDDQVTSERISELVAGIPAVSSVVNQLQIGRPPPPAPAPEPIPEPVPESVHEPAPGSEAEAASESESAATTEPQSESGPEEIAEAGGDDSMGTYTVEPGDSLWKIAEAQYGSGAKYMAIFEANRDILDNPDLIKPGQVLKIPAE